MKHLCILIAISFAFSGCVTAKRSTKSQGQWPYGATGPSPYAKDKDRFRTVTNTFNTFQGF